MVFRGSPTAWAHPSSVPIASRAASIRLCNFGSKSACSTIVWALGIRPRLQLFGSIFYAGRVWLRVVDNLLRTTPVTAESPHGKRNNLRTSKLWVYSLEHLELDLALSFWNIRMAMRPDATPATLDLVSMALCNIDQYMMPASAIISVLGEAGCWIGSWMLDIATLQGIVGWVFESRVESY